MRIEGFLQNSAQRFPDKVALIVGDRRVTYREMDESANRLANVLRQRGVRRDDRVVIFLDNSLEAVVGLFGTLKAGATFSIVNPTTKTDKLEFILNNCRPSAVITHQRLLAVAAPAIDQAPSVLASIV